MNKDVEIVEQCRFCRSENIEDVVNFGPTALANSYLTDKEINEILRGEREEFKANLSYFFCKDCLAFQIRESVSPEKLFSDYLYASSTSGNLLNYFKDYSEDVIKRFDLSKDSFVVVIASNDGVELRNFIDAGIPCLGVEPATNLSNIANASGYPTLNKFFGAETAEEIVKKHGQANCIIFNNCFAHLYDYNDFVNGLNILLKQDGFAVFENSYLVSMLNNNLFDILYHEHSTEWSLCAITNFLNIHELEPFDFIQTSSHGGSFRCFIQHENGSRSIENNVYKIIAEEIYNHKLNKVETYKNWFKNLKKTKDNVSEFVNNEIYKGKSFCGYGYPAKATTLCNFLNIGDIFDYIVEDSKFKVGKYTPDYYRPIYSPKMLMDDPVEICFVLAWNFFDLIVKNNPEYKGMWINPLKL